MESAASATRVLIVGLDQALCGGLAEVIALRAQVHCCNSFRSALAYMDAVAQNLIVTDLRLNEYNGLHLVYRARVADSPARAIVYDKDGDLGVATEVHRAGAFFEVANRLLITLPSYIAASLPPSDRRVPTRFDRRAEPRGGRRLWDRHILSAEVSSILG
jgi:DNA-binding NtrC family response regulator